ncbi:SNARE-like superfamily protein [Forsythia ovata]|uniref:SNARE-like superfamily protein n=1 Tax=Forsythia ovata TaxID=205694 RepID=A0ABD1WMT9_9LAMI
MVPDPDLVHYACIAKGTTVLAEFNSRDESLSSIAAKCLEKTPRLHSTFTHTVRAQTYTFLIDDPFAYFAIFDQSMENLEGLAFLKSVKEAFDVVFNGDLGKKKLERLTSHCFQGEFNPVFHQLAGPGPEMDSPGSPVGRRLVESGVLYSDSGPLRGRSNGDSGKSLNKKRLFGEFKMGGIGVKGRRDGDKKVNYDEDGGDGIGLSREFSLVMHKNGSYSGELMGHHKAKKVWKKQVWVVLSLDLFICAILFVVWLWVCRGFKCVDS